MVGERREVKTFVAGGPKYPLEKRASAGAALHMMRECLRDLKSNGRALTDLPREVQLVTLLRALRI